MAGRGHAACTLRAASAQRNVHRDLFYETWMETAGDGLFAWLTIAAPATIMLASVFTRKKPVWIALAAVSLAATARFSSLAVNAKCESRVRLAADIDRERIAALNRAELGLAPAVAFADGLLYTGLFALAFYPIRRRIVGQSRDRPARRVRVDPPHK